MLASSALCCLDFEWQLTIVSKISKPLEAECLDTHVLWQNRPSYGISSMLKISKILLKMSRLETPEVVLLYPPFHRPPFHQEDFCWTWDATQPCLIHRWLLMYCSLVFVYADYLQSDVAYFFRTYSSSPPPALDPKMTVSRPETLMNYGDPPELPI